MDERVFDPLDLELRVAVIIKPPLDYWEGLPSLMKLTIFPFKSELSDGDIKVLIYVF